MNTLKYTVIKTEDQYYRYCRIVEKLVFENETRYSDDIELLELLINKWDEDHNTFANTDPVELLKSLMADNGLKAKDLSEILNLSKGTVSKILNYQKGFSKQTIRILSTYFKLRQEAFNRHYDLVRPEHNVLQKAP
jgi:HTH-type transcriptional regulator/antitoxin HigA